MSKKLNDAPLISVVITTYNYANFITRAIESVLTQSYPNIELIIIDDGSTDETASIISANSSMQYFYQENQGLSAARNNGIRRSRGKYLVFLDADDWLHPDALKNDIEAIHHRANIAFVSGNYFLLRAETNELEEVTVSVSRNHYAELLQRNYIGMHGAVMFRRWVLQEMQYDETLLACEDYDLYLRIARKYPVIHHQKFIATYYFHPKGLSHDHCLMMNTIITVMKSQALYIKSAEEKRAYQLGLRQWKDYEALLNKNP